MREMPLPSESSAVEMTEQDDTENSYRDTGMVTNR